MANSGRNNNSCTCTLLLLNISIFVVCTLIYLVNELIPVTEYGYRQGHLNDLLAMPLLLSYTQLLCFSKTIVLKVGHILGLLIVCSIMWEVVTPYVWSKSTADYIDVAQYILGTIIYLIIHLVYRKWRK